jgi:hypothetical protein
MRSRECSSYQHLWKGEGSKMGQTEKSSYNIVSIATVNPMEEVLEYKMPIRFDGMGLTSQVFVSPQSAFG